MKNKIKVLMTLFTKFNNKIRLTMQYLFYLYINSFDQIFAIWYHYLVPLPSSLPIIFYVDDGLVMIWYVPLFFINAT